MIVCEDLVRIFRGEGVEVQALQGLSLRVEQGELVAVVGASGSGKSTLLSILSAQDSPTAGSARVAGRDLTTLSRSQRIGYRRKHVGFVWQQTGQNLLPHLTSAENVELPLVIAGTRASTRSARSTELLEMLAVGELAARRPHEMSGGQQQRVAIAVALAAAPDVLLADEPTGQLDEVTSVDVLEQIRTVNRETGVTTLIVTHDSSVSEHVTRTVQIRDGRVAGEVHRTAGDDGEHHSPQEYAVIDRVGRLQLPSDYVDALGLRDRVRLTLESDHVEVHPQAGRGEGEEPR